MNDSGYLLIGVGILIVLDIGLDIIRLWTQSAIESRLINIEAKIEAMRIDLNGKAKMVLDLAVTVADQAGYKRARDEQALFDSDIGTKTVTSVITTEATQTVNKEKGE